MSRVVARMILSPTEGGWVSLTATAGMEFVERLECSGKTPQRCAGR